MCVERYPTSFGMSQDFLMSTSVLMREIKTSEASIVALTSAFLLYRPTCLSIILGTAEKDLLHDVSAYRL